MVADTQRLNKKHRKNSQCQQINRVWSVSVTKSQHIMFPTLCVCFSTHTGTDMQSVDCYLLLRQSVFLLKVKRFGWSRHDGSVEGFPIHNNPVGTSREQHTFTHVSYFIHTVTFKSAIVSLHLHISCSKQQQRTFFIKGNFVCSRDAKILGTLLNQSFVRLPVVGAGCGWSHGGVSVVWDEPNKTRVCD